MSEKRPLTPEQKEARRLALARFREANPNYMAEWKAKNRERLNAKAAERARERRATDPEFAERLRARMRESHHRNREKRLAARNAKWPEIRDHSNAKRRAHHAANREQANVRRKMRAQATRAALPWAKFFHSAQQRAKKKNVPFWLTRAWCADRWTGRCEITGITFDLTKTTRGPGPFSPSLDRITPALGYVPENCRFILWAVNALKGEATDAEMLLVAEAIVKSLRISNP